MRLLNNKKGIEFLPMFMFVLIPFLVIMGAILMSQINDNKYVLGEVSNSLINTYNEIGNEQAYINLVAKTSAKQTYNLMLKSGGNPDYECGSYLGYPMLNNNDKNCIKDTKKVFIRKYEQDIRKNLFVLPYTSHYNYELPIEKPLTIKATTEIIEKPIYIGSDKTKFLESIQQNFIYIDESETLKGVNDEYIWPLEKGNNEYYGVGSHLRITSCVGDRLCDVNVDGKIIKQCRDPTHDALDISGNNGDPVYAVSDGVVELTGGSYNQVKIKDEKYTINYLHNSQVIVNEGDVVKQGQLIALVGNYGPAGGPQYGNHLHLSFIKGGVSIDPFNPEYEIYNPENLKIKFQGNLKSDSTYDIIRSSNCVYNSVANNYAYKDYIKENVVS